jgi:hypothetical protein
MTRASAVFLLAVLSFTSPAIAGITQGGIVPGAGSLAVVVDLDGNGLDDLLYNRYVLLAQGGGSFVRSDLALRDYEFVADRLDVNGDGRADLLTKHTDLPPGYAYGMLPGYSVRIQGPSFTFGDPIEILPTGTRSEPHIGDLDGDGRDDLLLQRILFRDSLPYAAEMTVALSRDDGTFENKEPFLIPTHPQWGRSAHRLLMGDVNRDGRNDVVIRTTRDLVVLLSRGNGVFTVASRYLPLEDARKPGGFGTWDTDLADLDRNGSLDVVLVGTRTVHALMGDGRGGFHRHTSVYLPLNRAPIAPKGWEEQALWQAQYTATPRTLWVGEFIAEGRTEVVGATGEGDICVVALDGNRLREVAPRIATPHLQADLYLGSFRQRGSADLLIVDNFINGSPTQPKPTLFHADAQAGLWSAVAPPARTTRGRAVAPRASSPLEMSVDAKDCAADSGIHSLVSDGLWMHNDAMEGFLDEGGLLHYRWRGIWGALQPSPEGGWVGTTRAATACGEQEITIRVNR